MRCRWRKLHVALTLAFASIAAVAGALPYTHAADEGAGLDKWGAALVVVNASALGVPAYFMPRPYSEFQISDGVGGMADVEAAAVFLDPFDGVSLADVPYEVYDALRGAEELAWDAEVELFGPAIARAGDSQMGRALMVGKTKNRVLCQTAALQAMRIKIAKHEAMGIDDPYQEWDLADIESDYYFFVEADKQNIGKRSLGVFSPGVQQRQAP